MVYSREYEQASHELLRILKSLRMGAEFAGHEVTDENRSRLYTRLATAITTLLADPGMQLSQDGFDLLAVEHATLHAIFLASEFGNADHLLRQFGTPDAADPGRLHFTGPQNLVKLLICYSLDSEFELDFELFFRAEPQLSLPAYLGMLAHTVVLSATAHRRREKLLTLGALFENVELKPPMLTAARDVYMQCSYATGEHKHDVKHSLNTLMRRLIEKSVALPTLPPERPRPERPTILVQLEWFHSAHAMYRCYAPSIRKLREKFRLVAICHERALDDVSKQLFDLTIETEGPSEMLQDIVEQIRRLRPDIVYYPSVGMNVRCVALATVRLGPIQIATMGHPATTNSEAIDYVVVPEVCPGDLSRYKESVVLAQGLPPMAVPVGEEFPHIVVEQNPTVLRVAVPAMASKLNAPFLATCRNIARKSRRSVEFNFLPSKDGVLRHQLTRQIHEWLPEAVVHPRLDYNEYLERLSAFHLHLSPFPFGGTNSNIDSMRIGIPIVALEGQDVHSQSDAAMIRAAGLPESLIARTPEQYERIAIRLINDESERMQLKNQLLNTDIADLFFGTSDHRFSDDFLRIFWWIYQRHEAIQQCGTRRWSVKARESFSSDAHGAGRVDCVESKQ